MVHSKDKIEERIKDLVDNFSDYIAIFKTNGHDSMAALIKQHQ